MGTTESFAWNQRRAGAGRGGEKQLSVTLAGHWNPPLLRQGLIWKNNNNMPLWDVTFCSDLRFQGEIWKKSNFTLNYLTQSRSWNGGEEGGDGEGVEEGWEGGHGAPVTAIGQLERDTHSLCRVKRAGVDEISKPPLQTNTPLCTHQCWDVQIFHSTVAAWFSSLYRRRIRHGSTVINETGKIPLSFLPLCFYKFNEAKTALN